MKKLLFICICLAFTYITAAKTGDRKWNIEMSDSATLYTGDLGNDFYKTDMTFYGVGSLTATLFDEKKDADNDGVADRNDKCPNTPAGVVVDKNGCPLDKDNDGVADYLDECPDSCWITSLEWLS